RAKLLRQIRKGIDFPSESIYPNFGEKWERPPEQQHVITFSAKNVRRFGEKIVRGIFYIEGSRFIEPPYTVEVHVVHDEHVAEIIGIIDKFGEIHAREPGIVVCRAVSSEDAMSCLFKIEIWQQFKMYATVYNSADLPQPTF